MEGGDRNWELRWAAPRLLSPSQLLPNLKTDMDRMDSMALSAGEGGIRVLIERNHKDLTLDPGTPPSSSLPEPSSWAPVPLKNNCCLPHPPTFAQMVSPSLKCPFSCFSILPLSLKAQVQILLPPPQFPQSLYLILPSGPRDCPQTGVFQKKYQSWLPRIYPTPAILPSPNGSR